jgi:transcriptional regulator with PAS, ATPase and Fis domain
VLQFDKLFVKFSCAGERPTVGQKLAEFYPEVIGLEETFAGLLDRPAESFALNCVNREREGGDMAYLDFRIIALPTRPGEEALLLFTVSDETNRHKTKQELLQQKNEMLLLKSVLGSRQQFLSNSMLGSSPPIMKLKELAQKVAQVPAATVLLQGESGTGKSHVARVIHQLSFPAGAPFVEINCAAIPEPLLEAELFGHEKGAFTHAVKSKAGLIEEAEGGTLFLDEIGDLPLNLQAKLLHVLETRKFRRLGSTQERRAQIRWIAATNRELKTAVAEKQFRDDLYYRLNVVTLTLPPLRELGDDVLALAENFIAIYNLDFKKKVAGLQAEAKKLLLTYHWPGNVRELRNVIERAMIFCDEPLLRPQDLSLPLPDTVKHAPADFQLPPSGIQLEELEKSLLAQALQQTQGNKTRAAALLGLTRDTLRYRLEKFGIE